MVFSSVPLYLDPPNWQQQQSNYPQPTGVGSENLQLPPPPPRTDVGSGGGGGPGSIRPGSMADRARLAKIPQPAEANLKCPRCESTNTKFCYFNNYSRSQPRHFCKNCRRYWTRGGALRNVPVGGGCRRNKRSKSSNSTRPKSPAKAAGSSSTSTVSSNCCATDMLSHLPPPPSSQLHFLPPLHHLGGYDSGDIIGLNFGGFQPPEVTTVGGSDGGDVEFQIGTSSGAGGSILSTGLAEQWRLPQVQQIQQFPFLADLEPPNIGLFQCDQGDNVEQPSYVGVPGQLRSKPLDSAVTGFSQLASVKVEDINKALMSRNNILGTAGNDQYWPGGGSAWTDISGFTSSSTSHML
ncbi:hypothetical protein I3843_01G276900 [Carya illinoinensis]|uniref:Dof zinc finger protein n=1 Tax=Carya illinoinensis TaxID=32201 RepID=A0A8T1RV18_CARIL|nr:dof zinc finger protein DOF3.6-like [Carya illinoinensis]KAG6670072.1 hypothetical protein CIPAW_01G285500 [Carya illinoinensis]KAG7998871.1 hypothetical protein I3843_01G276900 [Carya illinoinensis]